VFSVPCSVTLAMPLWSMIPMARLLLLVSLLPSHRFSDYYKVFGKHVFHIFYVFIMFFFSDEKNMQENPPLCCVFFPHIFVIKRIC
jgi:hypothetical protein